MANTRLQVRLLPDGKRLHIHDGPIDLILHADASERLRQRAFNAATNRMETILDELCVELPLLRGCVDLEAAGMIARSMQAAVRPYVNDAFITPMAAVAGAVADEVLKAMLESAELERAFVNNGGDVALHVARGATMRFGLVNCPDYPTIFGSVQLVAEDGVGGVATSGWRGRSHSLGIADAVTVLAATAAGADAAATMIANAVDLPGHPNITRVPCSLLDPNSDLGDLLVTKGVSALSPAEVREALTSGRTLAATLHNRGLIKAAALHLHGQTEIVGWCAKSAAQDQAFIGLPPVSRTMQ